MTPAPRTSLALVAAALLAACSNDPVTPRDGPATESGYDASIELSSGAIRSIFGFRGQACIAGNLLAYRDGAAWRPLPRPASAGPYIEQAWATANDQLYVRDWNRVYRLRNGSWDTIEIPDSPYDVCPFRDGRMVVASRTTGETSLILRFDGGRWEVDSLATPYTLRVSGDRYDNVFATGDGGRIYHFDGTSWTDLSFGSTTYFYRAWRFGTGPLYVSTGSTLYELNGNQLTLRDPGAEFAVNTLRPADGNACFVVGTEPDADGYLYPGSGVVYRLEGSVWTKVMSAPDAFFDAWISDDDHIYAAANERVWRHDGVETREIFRTEPSASNLRDLWMSPEGTLFAGGWQVLRNDDGTWRNTHLDYLTDKNVYAMSGRSDRDFFAVGSHMIAHYYDDEWHWEGTGFASTVYDIWVGEDRTLALSSQGILQRVHGAWQEMEYPQTGEALRSIGGAADVVYVVGTGGLIFRLDGHGEWVREESPTSAQLLSVVAFDNGRAIAVGEGTGYFLVRDNRGWRQELTGSGRLRSVCGASPTNVFAVGDSGVLHFDGRGLTCISDAIPGGTSIVTTARGDILACDPYSIVRYRRR